MDCLNKQKNVSFGMDFRSNAAKNVFGKLEPRLQAFARTELDKIAEAFNTKNRLGHDIFLAESDYDTLLRVELTKHGTSKGRFGLLDTEGATREKISDSIEEFDSNLDPVREYYSSIMPKVKQKV